MIANVLHVAKLCPNPRVANLLPSELVHRYHALPVAVDGERVTVAMAHPDDQDARQAIIATLGPTTCVIQADAQEIDRLIGALWPQNADPRLKILTWFPQGKGDEGIQAYAQSMAGLLAGELSSCEINLCRDGGILRQIAEAISQHQVDLLIFRSPDPPLLKRLLLEPAEQSFVEKLPTSLLIPYKPRWPIREILLVLHSLRSDQAALEWCIRLAGRNQAKVTILPLAAPAPGMFATLKARHNLSELLARDCPLGNQLRSAAQRLVDWQIEGKLRLRDEPVDQQVRCEVAEGNYDLVIFGAETHQAISRWVLGQLVNPLLSWADRPVLIAKNR
ncbi:MAG: universal stress protein [Anaerolineales bacterium]